MSLAAHCDREGCDSWQRLPDTTSLWLCLYGGAPNVETSHFCCLDCLMRWAAANSIPTESIPT